MSSLTVADPAFSRRSDLDALRAVAMLLGIALHASMSFFPVAWVVTDRQQNPALGLVFSAIHGFRMPLFFVMSGYFSAMLLDRRGRWSLVKHRFLRVFLPLLLGMVTIVPVTFWISSVAMSSAPGKAASVAPAGGRRTSGRRRPRETSARLSGTWRTARTSTAEAASTGQRRCNGRRWRVARRSPSCSSVMARTSTRSKGTAARLCIRRPFSATRKSSTCWFRTAPKSTRRTSAARRRWGPRPLTRGRHVSSRR